MPSFSLTFEGKTYAIHIPSIDFNSALHDNLIYICPRCGNVHGSIINSTQSRYYLAQHFICVPCGGGGPWVDEFLAEFVFNQLPESLILSRLTALIASPYPDFFRV